MQDLIPILYKVTFYDADKTIDIKITNNGKSVIFNNSEFNPNYLINYGITTYPTQPLLQFKNKVLTLYDPKQNLYFDRRQNINVWTKENPTPYYNEPIIKDGILDLIDAIPLNINKPELAINHTPYNNLLQQVQQAQWLPNQILITNATLTGQELNITSVTIS